MQNFLEVLRLCWDDAEWDVCIMELAFILIDVKLSDT